MAFTVSSTRLRVSALTAGLLLSARETVALEMPSCFAILRCEDTNAMYQIHPRLQALIGPISLIRPIFLAPHPIDAPSPAECSHLFPKSPRYPRALNCAKAGSPASHPRVQSPPPPPR